MSKPVCIDFVFVVLKSKKNYFYIKENSSSTNESGENYNPWPGYHFTGKLRPYPQVRRFN